MDPDYALEDIARYYEEGNMDDAQEAARFLMDWLQKNGFPACITGKKVFDRFAGIAICKAVIEL